MLRIAYHTLLDDVRSHQDHLSLDQEDEDGETQSIDPGYEVAYSDDLHARDTLALVEEYLQTLSPRDRSILTLRIWDDLSYDEIASITGESVSNAKKIVSRGLEKIAANVSYCFIFSLLLHYVY
jgi:RNA polymerase sigma factor (sigma-70 family)